MFYFYMFSTVNNVPYFKATLCLMQVNKAQNAEKGLNPSRSKDEKGRAL